MDSSHLAGELRAVMHDDEFVSAMEAAANAYAQYRELLPLIPYTYTRTRLLVTPRYEIIAMLWSSGSSSPIHDHGGSRCWVLMMDGALAVENYERTDEPGDNPVTMRECGSSVLRRGDLDHQAGWNELHRVHNPNAGSAVSLQLYAEPIARYTVVDSHSHQSRIVKATCDRDLTQDRRGER